ncbi:MAG TPA: AAA family ATPase [Ktedonobacterales bacterium]|nr:AAA family ATPase [Ktedonobacterales bacterium]
MTLVSATSTTSARAFGLLLKRYRRAAHLTQAQLAQLAGFSVVYISMLERGVRRPQRTTATLLADALSLSPAECAALEAVAPLPSPRDEGDAAPRPPTGGFLGATPVGLLVGREAELVVIEDTLQAVAQGQGRMLTLSGEPGIGKTRLAQEITVSARVRGFHVLTGRCYEPQQSVAWYPFLEALSMAAAGIGDAASSALSAQWPEVARLVPDHPENNQAPTQINDRAALQRLLWQVTSFLRALANQAPLALLLDDLHWADSASLDLLQHLARHSRDHRILLVATYRDVEVNRMLAAALHDLNRDELVEQITVLPLASEETAALIGVTLGGGEGAQSTAASVSLQLARLIQQRGEGNAFFTRQLTRALQEQGNLRFEEGEWRLGASEPIPTPESIRAVIGQRLAHLAPLTQDTLREASVLGQIFAFADLQHMSERGEREVEEALEEATRAGIVREGQHDRYHFNHALTLDTLSADLSTRRKRRLHRAAADAIERLHDHERRATELVYHLLTADEGARALPYALLAGVQAEAVYAHAEAEGHYRIAATLASELGDQARTAQALKKLGDAVYLQGRNDEAIELLERALLAYEAIGDEDGELRALAELLEVQGKLGHETMEAAVARAQAVLARLEPADPSALSPALASRLAAVYRGLALVYLGSGRDDDQLSAAKRAVELARVAGDEAQLAWALHRLYATGRLPEDIGVRQEILAMAERTGQTMVVVMAHNMLGARYMEAGEFPLALSQLEQALVVAEQRQEPIHIAWQLGSLTRFLFLSGDWQRAHTTLARAMAIAQEVDPRYETWDAAGVAIWPGILTLAEGHDENGRRLLDQAMQRIEQLGTLFLFDAATCLLAEADLLTDCAETARLRVESYLRATQSIPPQTEALEALIRLAWAEGALGQMAQAEERVTMVLASAEPRIRVDALRIQALLAVMQERWEVAEAALDEALRLARAMPYPYAEAKSLWVYGRLEAARGNQTAARKRFTAALASCDRLGEGLYRKRIKHDLVALKSSSGPAHS